MRPALALLLAACGLAAPSAAPAAEGYPGSTWGELHLDLPHPGRTDLVLEGWTRQGVAFTRWNEGAAELLLQGYATLRYKWDSEGLDWNGYLGPGAGLSLDLRAPDGPLVSAGVEYVHQWNYRAGSSDPYVAPFLNGYHWWDLRAAWPGSVWADLRWQVPWTGRPDLVFQGWLRQGVVVARWRAGNQIVLLDPYLRLRYAADSLGLDWNNFASAGAGLALDLERPDGPLLSWGVEYAREWNLHSPGGVDRVSLFMRWYGWWDLRGK